LLLTLTAAMAVYFFAIDAQQIVVFAICVTAFYLVLLAWQTTVAVKIIANCATL